MAELLAVARVTCLELVRRPTLTLLAVAVVGLELGLRRWLAPELTLLGGPQALLEGQLLAAQIVLAPAALWLGGDLLAGRGRERRLALVLARPLRRGVVWLGIWLGLVLALLPPLALAGLMILVGGGDRPAAGVLIAPLNPPVEPVELPPGSEAFWRWRLPETTTAEVRFAIIALAGGAGELVWSVDGAPAGTSEPGDSFGTYRCRLPAVAGEVALTVANRGGETVLLAAEPPPLVRVGRTPFALNLLAALAALAAQVACLAALGLALGSRLSWGVANLAAGAWLTIALLAPFVSGWLARGTLPAAYLALGLPAPLATICARLAAVGVAAVAALHESWPGGWLAEGVLIPAELTRRGGLTALGGTCLLALLVGQALFAGREIGRGEGA